MDQSTTDVSSMPLAGFKAGRSLRPAALACAAAVTGAMLTACTINARPAPFEPYLPVASGEKIANDRCAVCHSVRGFEHGAVAAAPRFRDLALRLDASTLEARLQGIAFTGHGQMPPFVLMPAEAHALAAYIKRVGRTGS